MNRRVGTLALLAALAAGAAGAQEPAPDAIDALLRAPAEAPPAPPPEEPRPSPGRPVFIHESARTPDGPPTGADLAYDGRLRASAASAQAYQGPLEGGWTLAAGGHDLFAFELVDRGGGVEGAWRDLRRPGALNASGFLHSVERNGDDLTFRFAGAVLVLHPAAAGWTGELTEAGRTEAARLLRRAR